MIIAAASPGGPAWTIAIMMTHSDDRNHPTARLACAVLAAAVVWCTAGCDSSPRVEQGPSPAVVGPDARGGAVSGDELLAEVERRYVVGPAAARRLGYRIDWQHPDAGRNPRLIVAAHDSVFMLSHTNVLARLDRETGDRLWGVQVTKPVERIFGISYVPDLEEVYLTTGSSVFVLDAANGLFKARQDLAKIANTAPVLHDGHLIYGARNGQLTWHNYLVGAMWRGYEIAPTLTLPPVASEHVVAVAGDNGTVMALDIDRASQLWRRRLLDRIVAPPTISQDVVYVAGLDQHIQAYRANDGRRLWRYLTTTGLTTSPTAIGERVYQAVPGRGLMAFEARPVSAPGGVVLWHAEDVDGVVIAERDARAYAWDDADHVMTTLDAEGGYVVDAIALEQVDLLHAPTTAGEELFVADDRGRLLRLVPQHADTAATASR